MWREVSLAKCWIEGHPAKSGLYLTRWSDCSRDTSWFYLFDVSVRPEEQPLYFNNYGGSYSTDPGRSNLGNLTHHCQATSENFAEILKSWEVQHFNREKMIYERCDPCNNGNRCW